MINNLLRAVTGSESDLVPLSPASTAGTSGPSSPFSSPQSNSGGASSDPLPPGDNLVTAVGGWIAGVHDTLVDTASSGRDAVVNASSGGAPPFVGGMRPRNVMGGGSSLLPGGRGYYTDPAARQRGQSSQAEKVNKQQGGGGSEGASQPETAAETAERLLSNDPRIRDGTYRGRKLVSVSDVTNLYSVVDDPEARLGYDDLMSIAEREVRNASAVESSYNNQTVASRSTRGGSTGRSNSSFPSRRSNSRGKSKEDAAALANARRRLKWAQAKEEEMVDRMLSQFPEFGTNRPTVLTVPDIEEEEAGKLANEGSNAPPHPPSRAPRPSKPAVRPEDEATLSSGLFGDESASDLIWNLLGMPNEYAEDEGGERQPSRFHAIATVEAPPPEPSENKASGAGESVWDQDEIDLWSGKPARKTKGSSAKVEAEGPPAATAQASQKSSAVPHEVKAVAKKAEGQKENEHIAEECDGTWASRRRKHRERRRRRQDWDALHPSGHSSNSGGGGESSIATTAAAAAEAKSTLVGQVGPRPVDLVQPTAQSGGGSAQQQQKDASQQRQPAAAKGGGGAVIVDHGKQHW